MGRLLNVQQTHFSSSLKLHFRLGTVICIILQGGKLPGNVNHSDTEHPVYIDVHSQNTSNGALGKGKLFMSAGNLCKKFVQDLQERRASAHDVCNLEHGIARSLAVAVGQYFHVKKCGPYKLERFLELPQLWLIVAQD